jgi:phosphoribosylformimino-5-aminoimidazole carboxamide ribotide isomerase
MQIIPVLDIAGGIAVHAQAGDRTQYAPLESDLVPGRVGDPIALLRAFHSNLGIHECYVADLDAIQGGAVQRSLLRELVGSSRVVFSLDLRLGNPILHPALQDARGAAPEALSLAEQAANAGVGSILILDLGRVGTGCGVDLGLVESMRRRLPNVRLLAGGGVLTRLDLERMRDAGCDGALVASAIHTGRVTPADLAAVSRSGQSGASASRYVADWP